MYMILIQLVGVSPSSHVTGFSYMYISLCLTISTYTINCSIYRLTMSSNENTAILCISPSFSSGKLFLPTSLLFSSELHFPFLLIGD